MSSPSRSASRSASLSTLLNRTVRGLSDFGNAGKGSYLYMYRSDGPKLCNVVKKLDEKKALFYSGSNVGRTKIVMVDGVNPYFFAKTLPDGYKVESTRALSQDELVLLKPLKKVSSHLTSVLDTIPDVNHRTFASANVSDILFIQKESGSKIFPIKKVGSDHYVSLSGDNAGFLYRLDETEGVVLKHKLNHTIVDNLILVDGEEERLENFVKHTHSPHSPIRIGNRSGGRKTKRNKIKKRKSRKNGRKSNRRVHK